MSVTRINNTTALTMAGDDQTPITDAVIEWDGTEITYVGPADDHPDTDPAEIIDGSNCVAIPGLINAHTHLSMTLLRGFADDMPLQPWLEDKIWPTEMKLTPEDVYWGTRLGILELLRGGCTCFCDMYHYYQQAAEAAIDGNIRALPSGVLLGFIDGAREMLEAAIDYCRNLQNDEHSRIHPALGPHAIYTCPESLLRRVQEAALRLDIPIHIHVAETEDEYNDAIDEHGVSPVQYLEDIAILDATTTLAHCVWLQDDDIELLADRNAGVVHCPGSNMKLAGGFAPVPKLLDAGVKVGLGTDGAASNNNLDMFEEALLAAIIHKANTSDPTVVDAYTALTMATRNSAHALGLGDITGTLQAGKRADIALIDLSAPHTKPLHSVTSQLVYSAGASDVKMTVVDGTIAMRDGEFSGQDVEEIYREVENRAHRLCYED